MTEKIAIIGDIDTVVGFRLAGILKTFVPPDEPSTRRALTDFAADSDVSIIIITEQLADPVRDKIDEISEQAYPVIVEIPDKSGHLLEKDSPLRRLVKRAIGVELEGF
ncbi:MAG: V-type ATP synthase subunit F [Candidatus Thorarchaeota archaeon]